MKTTTDEHRRVAVVTGASSGIGRSIAVRLARSGHAVVINHLQDGKAAGDVVGCIRAGGGEAAAIEGDVSDEEAVERIRSEVMERFGTVHILINNAGIFPWSEWTTITVEEWDRVMAVNARGAFLMARALVPEMQKQGWGRVISMSSATHLTGSAYLMHYAASKAAIVGFSRSLARAVGDDHVTVNAITTGKTLTEGFSGWFEDGTLDYEETAKSRNDQCIRRFTQPEDIASLVDFLVSDDASFITGQLLNVDGGRNML